MVAVDAPASPRSIGRGRKTLALVAAVGLGCLLIAALGYYLLQPTPVPRPLVTISSPGEGQQVAVGEEISVAAIARGQDRIVRLELWADGVLQEVQASSLAGGSSPFPLVTAWLPSSPGPHTLMARAFNTLGQRTHASVTVEAVAVPDQDADGVPDEVDVCPDQPGWTLTQGCPDADGDSLVDADDACPDEAGPAASDGCPQPAEGDRDGDGVADDADASPDEAGSAALQGRPLATEPEASPAEPPAPPPDADGDGVADDRDLCPDAPGPADAGGCPPSEAGDRDGDGLADDVDLAPEEPGLPEHGGCPPPDADGDGDGVPDEDEMPEVFLEALPLLFRLRGYVLPVSKALMPVEFQLARVQTYQPYDEVVCYVSLGDGPAQRFGRLDSQDGTIWTIGEHVGHDAGLVSMMPDDQPLPVRVECAGYRTVTQDVPDETPEGTFGNIGAEEAYFDLGTLTDSRPPEVWDGRDLVSSSSSASMDNRFNLNYRICARSCDESPYPPPVLGFYGDRTDPYLLWTWEGDPDAIDNFSLRGECSGIFWRTIPKDRDWVSISDLKPSCSQECRYTLYAEGTAPGVESPPSNTVIWQEDPCPGSLKITFLYVTTYEHDNSICGRGPLYGAFWANGEYLWFDGADPGYFDLEEGYRMEEANPGESCYFDVQSMFNDINRLAYDYPTFGYEAPAYNDLSVPMRPGQDLTVGFHISDYNCEGAATILADQTATIPADHLMSDDFNSYYDGWKVDFNRTVRQYVLRGEHCDLYFSLEWGHRPETP